MANCRSIYLYQDHLDGDSFVGYATRIASSNAAKTQYSEMTISAPL